MFVNGLYNSVRSPYAGLVMFTIKEASARTGIPVASLRAWERRYEVVTPRRTESGYRLYDEQAISALSLMRRLVDDGWTPAAAAAHVRAGRDGAEARSAPAPGSPELPLVNPEAQALVEELLDAASSVDQVAIESVLDRAHALGPFETVTDNWLMPALRALGDAWASGRVDVAGEHAASYAVMRRLSLSFAAAASVTRGPRVVVGLPGGCHHELGALAFATAARRRGLAVVYVGADLPVDSWRRAVTVFPTSMAVLGVPTPEDRPLAAETAEALLRKAPGVMVAVGGAQARDLVPGVLELPSPISEAARVVEARLRG
jgi:MerR family transcriptional regulator, light-induced transcriptional regulator